MNNYDFCAGYINTLAANRPASVLDYGCGAGQIVVALRRLGLDAKGCDVFYEGGSYQTSVPAELLGTVIQPMNGAAIPFQDESFDFVTNNQVLEHVEDLDGVLAEIHRVLKPGGQVLSLFPDKSVWREGHCGIAFLHWFPKGSNWRVYYAALLRAIGFGHFKGEKTVLQWSRDFCVWLDSWTHYRPYREIRLAFEKRFIRITHIEDIWLRDRLGKIAITIEWLPRWLRQLIVRKAAGLVFVCRKAGPE